MPWTFAEPEYSRSQVDRAGSTLASGGTPAACDDALQVINNWRSSHSFPLNTFQMYLRKTAHGVDPDCLVAQRIKRLSSIEAKLLNEPTMKLSKMQDIGGCRAVAKNVGQVRRLQSLYQVSHLKHELARENDYIEEPRASGYRSLHRVYRYYSDKKETYNGLQVEIQMRSQLQHAWATAVETVGTFIKQALKASQGDEQWLQFFKLMGSALALREKTPLVPGTPQNRAVLVREIRDLAKELDVSNRLTTYGGALRVHEVLPEMKGMKYWLLILSTRDKNISVQGYQLNQLDQATTDYLLAERNLAEPGMDAVLVSVESVAQLRRAYPNYFLDTERFLKAMKRAIA